MAELREIRGPMNSNDGISCKFPVSSERELMLKQRMTSQDGFDSKAKYYSQNFRSVLRFFAIPLNKIQVACILTNMFKHLHL